MRAVGNLVALSVEDWVACIGGSGGYGRGGVVIGLVNWAANSFTTATSTESKFSNQVFVLKSKLAAV